METERVVITGLGTINAIAGSVPEFCAALRNGDCGIGPVNVFDTTDFKTHTGGEVKRFAPQDMIPSEFPTKRMSRSDIMAMAATIEALKNAGLFPVPEGLLADTGVVIGGGAGGMLEGEEAYRQYLKEKGKGVRFSRFSSFCCASSADHIASRLNLMGPKTTFMTACSSGATAMGYARDLIRAGMAKVVIAGGTEPLSRITYATFNALGAVDPEFCKPFDKNRQGISLGEGAGILILESLSHALNRGAQIHGEILGYGVSCDAYHMTAPDPQASGAVRCMRTALQDAGVHPERVRLYQCPWHGDACQRSHGNPGDQGGIRQKGVSNSRQFHQIDDGSHAGGGRCHRRGCFRIGDCSRIHSADNSLDSA